MARLILSSNDGIVKEYPIDKEIFTIGRKTDNDIHINDLAVSNNHAKILSIFNDAFLEDMGSTNGTYIGKHRIDKHALQDGETFTIGKHKLTYVNSDVEDGRTDFENTMIMRAQPVQADHEIKTAPGNITPGPAKLLLISGANAGKELQLTKILTTLGKPGLQVAAISRRPTGYFIIPVDGGKDNNSPLVNGSETGRQHLLNDGDVIEIAGISMRFSLLHSLI